MSPILLVNPKLTRTYDDAGIAITKFVVGRPRSPKPYEKGLQKDLTGSDGIPSLSWYCIKVLLEYADQVHILGSIRLPYIPNRQLLKNLIPSWDTVDFSLRDIDPRLWALLIQIYTNLPQVLKIYPIALSDSHLTLLQQIPSTENFAMITILDLNHCKELTDTSIIHLKMLQNLCCFDCGNTQISTYGISSLARTLTVGNANERYGPWSLRVLWLRNCTKIDDGIYTALDKFPLICVIDLRETKCTLARVPLHYRRPANSHEKLFVPNSMIGAVKHLEELVPSVFPSQDPFMLIVSEEDKLANRHKFPVQSYTAKKNEIKDALEQRVENRTWQHARPESFYNRDLPPVPALFPECRSRINTSLMLYRESAVWLQDVSGYQKKSVYEGVRRMIKLEGRMEGRTSLQKWTMAMVASRLTSQNALKRVQTPKSPRQIHRQLKVSNTDNYKSTPVGKNSGPRLKLESEEETDVSKKRPQNFSTSSKIPRIF